MGLCFYNAEEVSGCACGSDSECSTDDSCGSCCEEEEVGSCCSEGAACPSCGGIGGCTDDCTGKCCN